MKVATLCYVRHEGKTLMLHRVKKENDMHEGLWNGLGGKLEEGESPEACAIREVKEESGLDVRNPRYKGLLTFPSFRGEHTWIVFVYEFTEFSGELLENPREGNLAWIDDEKLLSLPLNEGDHYFFEWMNEGKLFSATFHYKGRTMFKYDVIFH